MKCPYCNTENTEGAKFCKSCGAPFTSEPKKDAGAPTPVYVSPKPANGKKPALTAALVCIFIAVALIFAVAVPAAMSSGKNNGDEFHISSWYLPEEDETVFMYDHKVLDHRLDGNAGYQYAHSDDDTSALFIDEDDTLYYLNSKGLKKVAEDVVAYNISGSGKSAVYIDEDYNCYSVKLPSMKRTFISENVGLNFDLWYDNIITYKHRDGYDSPLYFFNGKTSVKLGRGYTCVGASKDGKYIYAVNDNESLYIFTKGGKDKKKLANDVSDDFIFNRSMSEIMFIADGELCISKKGGERKALCDTDNVMLIDAAYLANGAYVGDFDTFAGGVYGIYEDYNYDLCHLNKKLQLTRLAKSVDTAEKIGDYIYYKKTDRLYRVKADAKAEPEKLASDVELWNVSEDGKKLYYTDSDGVLYCKNGKKDAKEIAEDVYMIRLSDNGYLYYLNEYSRVGGALYRCTNDKDKKLIEADVLGIAAVSEHVVYYVANYEIKGTNEYNGYLTLDVYVSTNGRTFKRVLEGADY